MDLIGKWLGDPFKQYEIAHAQPDMLLVFIVDRFLGNSKRPNSERIVINVNI